MCTRTSHADVLSLAFTLMLSSSCKSDLPQLLDEEPSDLTADADAGPNDEPEPMLDSEIEPEGEPDDDPQSQPSTALDHMCDPGSYVVQEATEDSEAECDGCPSGTFSDEQNAEECVEWTACEPGEFVAEKGTASRDQACEPCPEDQTSAGRNAGACLPLDACPGGTVQTAPAEDGGVPECEPCESGQYCAGGTSLGQVCAEGEWDHDEDPSTDCVEQTNCSAGEYIDEAGSNTSDRICGDCESGSFGLERNAAECQPWTECPKGSYVTSQPDATSDRVCAGCAAATYTNAMNQEFCTPWTVCQAGEFVVVDGTVSNDQDCEACPEGEYTVSVNSSRCVSTTECPPGAQQIAPGTSNSPPECEDCAPGEYCAGGDTPAVACEPGYWDHDANPSTPCTEHTLCLAGAFVEVSGTALEDRVCKQCPDGAFSTVENAPSCQLWQSCGEGAYVSTDGSSTSDVVCDGCASGTFSDEPDRASCTAWTSCQPGSFVEAPGSATIDRSCSPCPDGTFSASVNAGSCVAQGACAQGTVQTEPATETSPAACDACSAGVYCAGGEAVEVDCGGATWDDDMDPATPCTDKTVCAAGQEVQNAGSATSDRSCQPCASGTFTAMPNTASCQAWQSCSAGSYVETSGSSTSDRACASCPSGTFSPSANQPSCIAWSVCNAPSFYMTSLPSATTDRGCAACTPPEATSTNNETSCQVPAFQMSGGTVVMEAESYHSTSMNGSPDAWTAVNISGISGDTAMELGPDDGTFWTSDVPTTAPRLVYYVNFTTTGTFYLHVRGDAGTSSAGTSDSCHAGIDNVPIATHYDFDNNSGVYGWLTQSVDVTTTGIHTVTVWGREDGFRVDKIVVSTNATAPSGNGPAESPEN